MVDTSAKIDVIVRDYIEQGAYFTINRGRQYGKTTTLFQLAERLKNDCITLRTSFEGKVGYFESTLKFADGFRYTVRQLLERQNTELVETWDQPFSGMDPMDELRYRITTLCRSSNKPVVLMIDEVDRASDYAVFAAFLGLLRDMYIERSTEGAPTFQSVILAGVHDVKNLKRKIRPEERHSYNSPWNIAASFTVDLSFVPDEIASMLREYEADHHTGMDIPCIADRLYFYTSGYPFLVSRLCMIIEEKSLGWSLEGVDGAETLLLSESNTLFDDMIKNIENNPPFGQLLAGLLFEGIQTGFTPDNPVINLGAMYGILKGNGGTVRVANVVFETRIANYLISVSETKPLTERYVQESRFVTSGDGNGSGRLDVDKIMERFSAFMRSEYRDEDGAFIERQARLLFLSFLKPIINGTGHYAVEPETRGGRRMDVVIFYGREEYIVELKIWRGEKAAEDAYDQLAGYLKSRGQRKGWLLSFADTKKTPRDGGTIKRGDCTIIETIVAFRDKE
jgi:hypothetical protein